MSRSYKKAIIKDKGFKDIYHKICRRVIKQHVKKFIKNDSDSIILPDEKEKLIKTLRREMQAAAKDLDFETAALIRDKVRYLQQN